MIGEKILNKYPKFNYNFSGKNEIKEAIYYNLYKCVLITNNQSEIICHVKTIEKEIKISSW